MVRGTHCPSENPGEPTGAGRTSADAARGETHGAAGAEVKGKMLREKGKAEEAPPAQVTSVAPAAAATPQIVVPMGGRKRRGYC